VAFVLFLVGIGIYELMEFCDTTKRCGRWMSTRRPLTYASRYSFTGVWHYGFLAS
jgi:hypothetical protein